MIRCPNCKMLNRLGSLHCGSCGALLTDKEAAAPTGKDPQFKAPKLSAKDSGEHARAVMLAVEALDAPTPMPPPPVPASPAASAPRPAARSAEASRTVMGMPVIRLEPAPEIDLGETRPLDVSFLPPPDPSIEDATLRGWALSDLESPPAAPPPLLAAARPPEEPPPPPPERRRVASRTLFGMRAAELHLGLARAEAAPEAGGGGPSLREAFPTLSDTAEQMVVRKVPDLGPPPAKPRPSRSDVAIQAVAPLQREGMGFAETAVMPAARPAAMDLALAAELAEGLAPLPPEAPATRPPTVSSPDVGLARLATALGRLTPAAAGRVSASLPRALAVPAPIAADPGWTRSLRLLAGICLIVASMLPWSASLWSRADIWAELMPLAAGAAMLALVFPRRAPVGPLVALGGLGACLLVLQFTAVGLPPSGAGAEVGIRFGLTLAGSGLLAIAGLASLLRPAR